MIKNRDLIAATISGLEATPILVSQTAFAANVVKRLGVIAGAACVHCYSGLNMRARGEPWLHRSTGSRYCLESQLRGSTSEPAGSHVVDRDPVSGRWRCAQGCPNTAWSR